MSGVTCAAGVDLLIDYLDGLLPAATVGEVEGHVAGCTRCQAFIASYRATPRILRDATDIPLPADVQSSLITWLRAKRRGS